MGSANPEGARAWLKSYLAANQQALEDFLNSKSDLRKEFLEGAFPYHSGPLPGELGGIATPLLLQWAETETAGLSYLRGVMAGLVRSGKPIPEVWCELHARILDGTASAPKVKSRGSVNDRRDELVLLLVTILQSNFGLTRNSNPLSQKGESAIEIVVDELKPICRSLSMVAPSSVETAISRRAKARSVDPILAVVDQPTNSADLL
jgi:hypothetical protein